MSPEAEVAVEGGQDVAEILRPDVFAPELAGRNTAEMVDRRSRDEPGLPAGVTGSEAEVDVLEVVLERGVEEPVADVREDASLHQKHRSLCREDPLGLQRGRRRRTPDETMAEDTPRPEILSADVKSVAAGRDVHRPLNDADFGTGGEALRRESRELMLMFGASINTATTRARQGRRIEA